MSSGRSLNCEEVLDINLTEAVLGPLEPFDEFDSIEFCLILCICFGNGRGAIDSKNKEAEKF